MTGTRLFPVVRLLAILAITVVGPMRVEAQQIPTNPAGEQSSQEEVLERIRSSGLNRSQMRSRLQMMGYDPGLADQYYDQLEGRTSEALGPPDSRFVEALSRMSPGIREDSMPGRDTDPTLEAQLLRADYRFRADSIYRARIQRQDSIALAEAGISELGLPIFGRSVFTRTTSEFEPVTSGPVPPTYRLGPGDEVELIVTGDVELAYQLPITRDGSLVIPDVGAVSVNGLTLAQLEGVLRQRLARVYSGVEDGGTTRFQVTLGRLRANQIFLVGEVERPGSYLLSGTATGFNALYQGGGPAVNGTYRNVEVRRGGGTVRHVDLYDYLLAGRIANDVQLENGDMVFVPLAGPRVSVIGEVRRPAIYEMREGETLADVLGFAGGFRAQAVVERVQIARILPPEERRPGVDRVVIDVPVRELLSGSVPLRDGDVVRVFEVAGDTRQYVHLSGEVRRPGLYEWRPGLTLASLLAQAEGLDSAAYTARGHIYRLDSSDGTRELLRVSFGDVVDDPLMLADRDSIVVYSREDLRREQTVELTGFVKAPGIYTLAEGMTLQDLILAAGGYTHGAYELEAEIARLPDPQSRTDTTARVVRVSLADDAPGTTTAAQRGMPAWSPGPDEVALRHGDRVFVRKAPGFEEPRVVVVTGEVLFPGSYLLRSRDERLADVIRRAGGPTTEAHPEGFQLIRSGHLVGTDLSRALTDGDSRHNVLLDAGDSLHIPSYDPTVLVTGAVAFETRALYEEGRGMDYYISQAGGYTEDADKDRVTVTYQNGEREVVDDFLLWRLKPRIRPGARIHVPNEPILSGFNWDRFLTQALAVTTTAVTVLLAISQLEDNQ